MSRSHRHHPFPAAPALFAVAILAGCGDRRDPERTALPIDSVQAALATQKPTHIDTVFSAEEEARRFRREVRDSTDTLRHAARSRDELLARFRTAVTANDLNQLRALVIDAGEFAWLIYPDSRYARAPYFLKPQTAWFQSIANSDHDGNILLQRLGGRSLSFTSVACRDTAIVEGRNRLWDGCRVQLPGDTTRFQLFGVILERDGRFKFLSLSNKL